MQEQQRHITMLRVADVTVKDRARKTFDEKDMEILMEALSSNIGLIHPIMVKPDHELVTGERRLKAITSLHEVGTPIKFAGKAIPNGMIPCIVVEGEFQLLDYLISEEVENTARAGFTWQELARHTAKIAELKQLQIDMQRAKTLEKLKNDKDKEKDEEEADSDDTPTTNGKSINSLLALASKGTNSVKLSKEALLETSKALYKNADTSLAAVKDSLLLNEALQNEEMRSKIEKAPTKKEALKIVNREETRKRQAEMAQRVGKELRSDRHNLINADCLEVLAKLPSGSIDVCLTDPIYGINAQDFGVAKRDTGFHEYDDTEETFLRLLPPSIKEVSRILKPAAHLYLFCDLSKFYQLKQWVEESSLPGNPWKVQSFPLHWIKVNGSRCPHPGFTFRKTVEYILFAYRGGKQSNHQLDSHFEVSTKRTEIHGAAKDPSGLKILLNNSCHVNDTVLDFMMGSGSTVVACQELKLRCTGIELDATHFGRATQRLKELENR